ncbi:2-keto-4-pentenoate hydratase, partial [Nocardioides sp.]|uniref:2-keto-4-pentenoate hydratase n=1 Tax=Nocardioides sp. TaxID=35761 RepID=UPI002EDB67FD
MTSQDSIAVSITAAVARLSQAQATGVPCAPVRDLIGTDDLDAAYAVQQGLVRARIAGGAHVVGRKIGATSKAVQDQLGVDQPDFGYLLDDMDVSPRGADEPISMRTLLQPRVEAEVAFVLARDLDLPEEELTIDAVREAVQVALPALEIVDSRIDQWAIGFTDTVADNASSGLFVVGTDGRSLDELEPREVVMSLTINGEGRSAGTGAACLGDPLRAGHLILSGALGPFVPFAPG